MSDKQADIAVYTASPSSSPPSPQQHKNEDKEISEGPVEEPSKERRSLEKRFAWKLDLIFCTYVILGYFIKYLDQTNYSNAFVSGMETDLHLYGNQRNFLNTWFSIGVIIGTVPSQLIQLRYVRPSLWIPSCELIWSALVMAMAGAKNIETLYVLRFFVGLTESCSFPGYAALLSSWYGPDQLGTRQQILEQVQCAAAMFSGYLQTGLYDGLNGSGGLAGWRWLFIFDGIISVPIAFCGYYCIPDSPTTTRALWLSKEERQYAVEKMEKLGRVPAKPLTLQTIKKVYLSKYVWAFTVPYVLASYGGNGFNYFNLWLSAAGYSVSQTNLLPTAGYAFTIVAALALGVFGDYTGRRVSIVIFIAILNTVANAMLAYWYLPKGAIFFAQFLSYIGPVTQPFIIAYGQEIFQFDGSLRQLLVATGNVGAYTWSAWVGTVLFPTYEAPHYKYGYQILIMFSGIGVIGTLYLKFIDNQIKSGKDKAKEHFAEGEEEPEGVESIESRV